MIKFVSQNRQKNLILFIHGFTGGKDTWKNANGAYFFEMLNEEALIADNFDIAYFEYFTTLTDLYADVKAKGGWIRSLFSRLYGKRVRNNSIEEISDILRREMQLSLSAYDNIVVIAHSMGGLISKASVIGEHREGRQSKIKLCLSLAVPHLGSDIATFGKLVSSNLQIKDLAPLSDMIPKLNEEWRRLNRKPNIKYFYGTHDIIVRKHSAVEVDDERHHIIECSEDHISICKPKEKNSPVYTAVTDFIRQFITGEIEEFDLKMNEGRYESYVSVSKAGI